jgi:phasin
MAQTDTKFPRSGKPSPQPVAKAAPAVENATDAFKATADTATTTAKDVADSAFSYSAQEMPELARSLAEQSLNQSREAFARMKTVAEQATGAMEESFSTARDSMREVHLKALDAAKANADATFELMRRLLGATSVSDALQLQATFARERFEAMTSYSKDVQGAISKAGAEAAGPAKKLFDQALNSTKAA